MAAVIYLMLWFMKGVPNWVIVITCVPAGVLVFFVSARLLGAPELAELRGKLLTAENAENAEETK
jgi:hypothetical protein